MLILQRKKGQSLTIGNEVTITISEISSDSVNLAINAPKDVLILRSELVKAAEENKAAAKTNTRVARNRQDRVSAPKQPVSNRRLYVGNLSYEATESDLEDVFKGIGEVNSVEIIYNPRTHKSKGYAFVEMKKMEDAIRSVDILHNQPFMGRNLLVSGANERQEQPRQPREDRAPREEQGSMAEVKETSTPLLQPEAPAPQSQEQ